MLNSAHSISTIAKAFDTAGWATVRAAEATVEVIKADLLSIVSSLGRILPGRNGLPVEVVMPETVESARPNSLSSRFGLAPLPLHSDTAHWSLPCRVLALACVDPGPTPTPTLLLDSRATTLTKSERIACKSAVFAIRNGRSSFYGSIIESGRPFIRLDPGCMMPMSSDGEFALEAFGLERQANSLERHEWEVGTILVIDNWRYLHARGFDTSTDRGRVLLRAMAR